MLPKSIYEEQLVTDDIDAVDEEFLLQFKIGNDFFALSFSNVVEICDFTPFVLYPHLDEKHIGIINIRGAVIPIRAAFRDNLRPYEIAKNSKYIIVNHPQQGRFGLLVDSVKKVTIAKSEIELKENQKNILLKIEEHPVRYVTLDLILESK